jgi:hypothetical protein
MSFYDANASAQHGWTTFGCEVGTADAVAAKERFNMSSLWGQLPWDHLVDFYGPNGTVMRERRSHPSLPRVVSIQEIPKE